MIQFLFRIDALRPGEMPTGKIEVVEGRGAGEDGRLKLRVLAHLVGDAHGSKKT